MRQNPARRAALVDAAIEVLAREGARGLTFRAVDAEAGVPTGTASNYFANRDDLFLQAGGRVYEKLQPAGEVPASEGPAGAGPASEGPASEGPAPGGRSDRDRLVEIMHETVERVAEYRSGHLALLELRLESTRRPELRAVLTRTIRADIDANIGHHRESGLPGDDTSVVLLHLALNWLILEQLTLPGVFTPEQRHDLVTAAVERALPPER